MMPTSKERKVKVVRLQNLGATKVTVEKSFVVILENGTAAVKFHSCPVKHIRIRSFVFDSPIREICVHLYSSNVTQYPLTNYVNFC